MNIELLDKYKVIEWIESYLINIKFMTKYSTIY